MRYCAVLDVSRVLLRLLVLNLSEYFVPYIYFLQDSEMLFLRRHHMKTLSETDCKVIDRTFAGLSVSPFLYIKIVHVLFHSDGTTAQDQAAWMIWVVEAYIWTAFETGDGYMVKWT